MVKIVIENLAQKEVMDNGSGSSVLKLVQANHIDWMHACGGKGRCTTCKFEIVEGGHQLSPLSAAELGYRRKGDLGSNERLACQAAVLGKCTIRIPDESKLPHITYTD
jgi:2Fe-2S ferredoxin